MAQDGNTDDKYSPPTLSQDVINDTFKRGALKYKTRGLTSTIHTYTLSDTPAHSILRSELTGLGAESSLLIVKSVDLEEQPKPHDVLKEVELLRKCNDSHHSAQALTGSNYILHLLGTATEEPDDFTSIYRLYFPYYPLTLSDWLDSDASSDPPPSSLNHINAGYRIALQLYTALAFLSSIGIAHRDIKPSNVLLTSSDPLAEAEGETRFQLKLCDFGTATDQARPTTCSTSTHPYTPPELLFSPKEGYDAGKVDVWQAACVVAEVFGERLGGGGAQPMITRKRSHSDANAPDEQDDDDEDDDDPFADSSSSTQRQPNWHSLQRTLFSDSSTADDTWLRRPGNYPSSSSSSAPPAQPMEPRHHRTLFPRSKPSMGGNDLALASAHFDFCGLPQADQEHLWPEAKHYQPSLARMPFPRREPPKQPDELLRRCVLLKVQEGQEGEQGGDKVEALVQVLLNCLQLSPGSRWTAAQVVSRLDSTRG